jgi:hypothetical protein
MNATASLFISTYNVKLKIIIYLYCQTYKLTLKTKFIKYLVAKAALRLRVISEQEEIVPNVVSPRKEKKHAHTHYNLLALSTKAKILCLDAL